MPEAQRFTKDTPIDDPALLTAMNDVLDEKGLPNLTPKGIQAIKSFGQSIGAPIAVFSDLDSGPTLFPRVIHDSGALDGIPYRVDIPAPVHDGVPIYTYLADGTFGLLDPKAPLEPKVIAQLVAYKIHRALLKYYDTQGYGADGVTVLD